MHRVLFLALLCAAVSCVKRTEVQVLKANQPLCIYLRRPNLPKCPGTKIPTDDSEFPVKSLEVDNVLLYKKDLLRIKKFDKDVLESKKLQRKQIMIHTNLTSSYMGYIVANRCVPTTLISQCQKSPFSNQTVRFSTKIQYQFTITAFYRLSN